MAKTQANWSWCHKCEGLFYAGHATNGKCPAGGSHEKKAKVNYEIYTETILSGQSNWRWCHKCEGLFYAGNAHSKCPAGGAHEKVGSGNYNLLHSISTVGGQSNWRWCHKCQGLFYAGNPYGGQSNWRWCHKCQGLFYADNPTSKCPAGGAHEKVGSGNYTLVFDTSTAVGRSMSVSGGQSGWRRCNKCQGLFFAGHNLSGENNWRWCHKCEGLFYAGHATNGKCPAGGSHEKNDSGNYSLVFDRVLVGSEKNWFWCKKCEGLFHDLGFFIPFPDMPTSKCPAGGAHEKLNGFNYRLLRNTPATGVQNNWRMCHKCQAMYFAGHATKGKCPAGGQHQNKDNGDYSLIRVSEGLCPAGGVHENNDNVYYSLVHNISTVGGQSNWRWCHKCQGLFYADNPTSKCPAGGAHEKVGSGNYTLYGVPWYGKCPAGGAHENTGNKNYCIREHPLKTCASSPNTYYRLPFDNDSDWKLTKGNADDPGGNVHGEHQYYAFDFTHDSNDDGIGEDNQNIRAARGGMVINATNDRYQNIWGLKEGVPGSDQPGAGNIVSIRHVDGTIAHYCHLMKDKVYVIYGQWVERGKVIALSGNTGNSSTPHLHFEVRTKFNSITDGGEPQKVRFEDKNHTCWIPRIGDSLISNNS